MLNGASNNGVTYEVLNMGISGYNTIQEYLLLKDKGLKFQPDLVLLGFFYNDSDPTNVLDKYGFLAKGKDPRKWTDLSLRDWLKKSKFARFVKETVLQTVFHKNLNAIPRYMNLRVQEKGWAIMKEYLNKINLLCTSHNAKFVIVNFPSAFQLDFSEENWVI
ncbi:MAG: hypothetical protein U9Q67_03530 [Patescibacteria group bacterium]|nr:hypothetical protein [Patescibacteria group bacterium]